MLKTDCDALPVSVCRGGKSACNPFSLNRCLDALQHPVHSRRWHLDRLPRYWSGSGTPHLLFQVWHQHLDSVPEDPMEAGFRTDEPDLATLMCQSGYLARTLIRDPATGQKREVPALPNDEVEDACTHSRLGWAMGKTGGR